MSRFDKQPRKRGLLVSALAMLSRLVVGWFDNWQAGQQDKREVARAVTENKMRLAQSVETHNQAWEMAALEGRDNLLRRLSFAAWSVPLLWAAFDAEAAEHYFKVALGALP
ncbi:MAG: hypothetical protein Q7U78_13200, partial [Gallionella sp.]|nr:hypothetical protein [Gallionella sp.]